ncbi:MAG: alkaline phosphatase family protein [Candidatus Aminicenantes bacterium]
MKEKKADFGHSPLVNAIKKAYQDGEEDESLEPIIAVDSQARPLGRFKDGDCVIFYDIRGEREVELTKSLIEKDFKYFPVRKNIRLNFVTMIEYDPSLEVRVAFPAEGQIRNTLSEIVSQAGLKLAKIAESEKAVHIGFFMNGRSNQVFAGEERWIVPSPQGINSYASVPEMSAEEVGEAVRAKIDDPSYQMIMANLANVDVVGHLEDKQAVLKAVETVDEELGKIIKACFHKRITLVVTSDHGTVEEWLYEDGSVNTGHTKNPVPFILSDFSVPKPKDWILRKKGELSDVAPTVLELLGLEKPLSMTGKSLFLNSPKLPSVKRRVLLLILDGWGMRDKKEGNLLAEAQTPHFDRLWSDYPHAQLQASGEAVGMPADTVGNSEAGHLHIGAGRRILLDRVRIDKAIQEGSFYKNQAFLWAMEGAKKKDKALHLLGIVSHYSSHGTIEHLQQLLRLAKQTKVKEVYVHSLIGRRGEKPESGAVYVNKVEKMCRGLSLGRVVTVMGRFWALDREENWDRVEKAYKALVCGEGKKVTME